MLDLRYKVIDQKNRYTHVDIYIHYVKGKGYYLNIDPIYIENNLITNIPTDNTIYFLLPVNRKSAKNEKIATDFALNNLKPALLKIENKFDITIEITGEINNV